MSELRQSVDDYLQVRRSLGYKLTIHGGVLAQFGEFLERLEALVITNRMALEFANLAHNSSFVRSHQRRRSSAASSLYLRAFDPRTEVPPADLLPAKSVVRSPTCTPRRRTGLMAVTPQVPLGEDGSHIRALIGLLAVSGMRVGEAIALDREDLELPEERLTVRRGKNGRSREVALHPSTIAALKAYARLRDELCPHPKDRSFLITKAGTSPVLRDRLARVRPHPT